MYFIFEGLDKGRKAEGSIPHHSHDQSEKGVVGWTLFAVDELLDHVKACAKLAVGYQE